MRQDQIVHLRRDQIDTTRWNQCIDTASNGLIYAYSYYLDALSTHWDALVWNDYEAVMPLPWRKKWGIYYLYQPAFTAQLGIFGNNINALLFRTFLNNIPKKFLYWDIPLNHKNIFVYDEYPILLRKNYVLQADAPYDKLYTGFRVNTRRNIKKAIQKDCRAATGIAFDSVLTLAKQTGGQYGVTTDDFNRFENLYHLLQKRQQAKTYGVFDAGNRLLASCVFFFSHNRAYYILVGNHPDGKAVGASHALIDFFLQEHAGSNLLLDFEGSDIPTLAFFYNGFGAVNEAYGALRINRLPWPINHLKK